jgi:hypothetical protein
MVLIIIGPYVFAWKFLLERAQTTSAHKEQEIFEQQHAPKTQARNELCANQLRILKAAVPHSPPDRMRATIQLNKYREVGSNKNVSLV